ncbi:MAG TPA: GLUG motif-containing protein [Roseiarcus sp.]|jgi:filamentous hemagglutinin family protein
MMLDCDEAVWRSVTALQAGAQCASGLRSRLAASTALALMLTAAPAWAQALPTGGSVAAGAASIARPNASTLNVNQSTNQAIINWNTFSVGAGDTVNFNQPGATSSTLNRVNGSAPSSIAGAINAPGTVLLVNPNGIEITKSGVIKTGSFAASTLGISDSDYLSGRYSFNGNGGSAAVINSGRINVSDGGFAALLGGQVANNGVISARLGLVALGAGEQATLDLSGDGFLSVTVPSSELGKLVDANGALVSNKGKIVASGGTVYLSAATAANVLRNAVNIPGSVRANTVGSHNGRIVINGGDGGSVNVAGRLAANGGKKRTAGSISVSGAAVRVSGKLAANGSSGGAVSVVGTGSVAITGKLAANGATARGGQVDVTGANVMFSGATIDAFGATGGGNVNLGGGPHATVALADAQSLLIDSATTVDASATGAGNGGHIVVWSDGLTTAIGALNAKGGPDGGNGGSVETSGQIVDFDGVRVDTSAANGAAGLWLVDPENLTIDASSAATISSNLANTDVTLQTTSTNASGTGVVTTGGLGDITIDSGISWLSAHMLTLDSYNAISIDAPITLAGGGLALLAGGALAINAPIDVTGAGSVNLSVAFDTTTVLGTSLLELSFGQGASLSYTGTPNTGQALTINGQAYTLLYKLADGTTGVPDSGTDDIAGIDNNTAAGSDAGHYALATNLVGTATFSAPLASESMSSDFTGVLEGLGHTISNLTINDPTYWDDVGLFGRNSGVIRDIGLVGGAVSGGQANSIGGLVGDNYAGTIANSYATAAVSGGASDVGGLVGTNYGWPGSATIVNSYATGVVSGGQSSDAGGLVGLNQSYGSAATISNSYATGAVSGGQYGAAGGLLGLNDADGGTASIANSYATGAVSGASAAGGLVGENSVSAGAAKISNSYATGAVSGYYPGGLVALNYAGLGAVTNSYWDVLTTGQSGDGAQATAPGSVNGYNPSTGSIGLTTAQLQSGVASFTGSAFAGGSGGLYPYLESFFPNGVQAVSGTAYSDAGGTPLASGTNGAVTVSIDGNGSAFGSATTGANGYYYVFAAANTLAAGSGVLAYTTANSATGATDGATLVTSAGAAAQSGVNVYGKTLSVASSATTLSASPSLALVETDAVAAAGSDANAQAALGGATGRGILATGASFTIDQPITTANTFLVQTSAGAPLTVAQPITISGFGGLGLLSGGSLAVDAPINVTGAGSVDLAGAYDTTTVRGTSLLELSFEQGASLSYTGAPNTGQALKINGQAYTLLYNLADGTTGLPDHGTDDIAGIDASGDAGHYALADNLIGTATFSTALAGAGLNVFSGVFEGLGHTITNLTINDPAPTDYVGLFGQSIGVIRDIGLVGGAVSGDSIVGGLVGVDYGGIVSSYATDAVRGVTYVGGLVGANVGELGTAAIVNSYAAGAVIGGPSSDVGGLVGLNEGALAAATIADSYATGAVSSGHYAGGLVGRIYAARGAATIANSYATGAVSGPIAGGLVALNNAGAGAVTNSYWDVLTTGQSGDGAQATAPGSVNGYNPSTGSIGLTTAQLQSGAASFTGSAFAGGAGGLYPYLASFFPNGVQAITGTAQTTGGAALSAAQVAIYSGGDALGGAVSSGANGYFYDIVPAGTLAASGVEIGATVTPSGGHAATGLLYTDAGTVTNDLLPLGAPTAGLNQQTTAETTYSALQTDLDATFGATAYSGLTTALATTPLSIIATGASFTLDQAVTEQAAFSLATTGANAPITISAPLDAAGQTVTLIAAGAISETAGAVSAGKLTGAASGPVSLTAAANAIGALGSFTVSNGAFTLHDSAALTIDGTVNGGAGATVLDSVGSLTIASGASVTGGTVTLATSAAFVNDAGSGAVIASNGRWLIYSDAPTGDMFGNLNSNNTAIWDATYGSSPPASIAAGGDRYVFAYQPTLTFTSTSASKSYGVDDTAALASAYSVSGLQSGVSGAFLGDSASVYSGAPSVTSAGAAAGAGVAGGPYTINVARGALRSLTGYAFAFVSSGQLTVNPETLPYEDPPSQFLISTNAPPGTDSVTICFDFQDVNTSPPTSHTHPTRRGRWRRLKRTAT